MTELSNEGQRERRDTGLIDEDARWAEERYEERR